METFIRFIIFSFLTGLILSCSPKPVKTIENLKTAYDGESTASAKYAAYAEKAKAENLDTIDVMFLATSRSEAVHAANHLKVLVKLGVKTDGPDVGPFDVMSTAENLTEAIKGESSEFESMYPGFIAEAEKEKCTDAVKSFSWALDTEKKHASFYNTALTALNSTGEKNLPFNWLVCPTCGNTYDLRSAPEACDFCLTARAKFMAF